MVNKLISIPHTWTFYFRAQLCQPMTEFWQKEDDNTGYWGLVSTCQNFQLILFQNKELNEGTWIL